MNFVDGEVTLRRAWLILGWVTNLLQQWRFYVGARGHRPPNLAQAPQIFRVITVHKLYISCLILDNWTQ